MMEFDPNMFNVEVEDMVSGKAGGGIVATVGGIHGKARSTVSRGPRH